MSTPEAATATAPEPSPLDSASVEAGGGRVVDLPEPATPEDNGEPAAVTTSLHQRDDKKRERGQAFREIREQAARETAELRALIQAQAETLAEIRGRMAATPAAPAPVAPDAYGPKIAQLRREMDRELLAASKGETSMDRFYELQEQVTDLVADRKIEAFRKTMPAQEAQKPVEVAVLEGEFPWMASNEKARRWAVAAEDQLIAEGRPATLATSREALAAAAAKFGLGNGKPATPANPGRRYSGAPSGTTGGEDEGPQRVVLGAKDMELVKAVASMRGLTMEQAAQYVAKLAAEK